MKIGKNVVIQGSKKAIYLHDNSEILDNSRVVLNGVEAIVELRKNSSIGYSNFINVHSRFVLGENSMSGPFVSFNDSDHKIEARNPVRFSGYTIGRIEVGNDVWIGTGARLLKNVVLGDGAIVGANAVVTKDVPAWAVVVGIPARFLKSRDDLP